MIVQRDSAIDERVRITKINQEEDTFRTQRIHKEFSKQIVQARLERKWTQKDLARAMNETTNTVASFENGTAVYDRPMIQKFQRILRLPAYPQ